MVGQRTLKNTIRATGVGLHTDLPHDWGFIRLLVGGEWIHFSEASSPVGYVQLRADFGVRF